MTVEILEAVYGREPKGRSATETTAVAVNINLDPSISKVSDLGRPDHLSRRRIGNISSPR